MNHGIYNFLDKNKVALIEWTHRWRKILVEDMYDASGDLALIQNASLDAQRFLCKIIVSKMLAERNLPDTGLNLKTFHVPNKLSKQAQNELLEMDLEGLPFEVLSDVYESYLAQKLTLNPRGELEYLPERSHRKDKGIYYTPPYIVRHIVDRTLGEYLQGKVTTPAGIRHLRILDPSCGSGCFLAYAFDVLAEFYTSHHPCEPHWPSLILGKHLYGVDIDSDAVEMTNIILTLKALERTGRPLVDPPKLNIRQDNFLIPASPDHEDERFSMILGNPPYGAKLAPAQRKEIKSSYGTHRSSDSSSLFVEKAVKALKDDGILGFIVPKSLSYVVSWQPIRRFLLDECRIIEITDARKAFKGVLLEQMVIIAQKHSKSNTQTKISILRPDHATVSHSIDDRDLTAERFSMWFSNQRIRAIIDKIWEKSVPLGSLAEIWNGLSLQGRFTFSDKPDLEYDLPCLRGKDIQRYHLLQNMQYIKTKDTAIYNLPVEIYQKPRIIVQDIIAHIHNPMPHVKLTATIDRSESWLNVNTVTNMASSQYPLEYLCGILNSRLISWYAYDFIYNRSIRTMHFRRGYADHIPVRRIDADVCPVCDLLIEHVNRIMTLHSKGSEEDEIDEVDRKIDELIYQLYGITHEDVDVLKEHAGLYTSSTAKI